VLTTVLPNASTESRTYHVRGWLSQVSIKPAGSSTALITRYEYDKVGQLKQATLPDGSWSKYTYDAAHRLTDVEDSAQNKVHYTLDNAGNRTGEDYKDPTGSLQHTRHRRAARSGPGRRPG
jgi:YD repeat-containing protein